MKVLGIEMLLYRWGLSEFILDEERQVCCDQDGRAVLSCYLADRNRLFGGCGE